MTANKFIRDSFQISFEQGLKDVVRQEILDYAPHKAPAVEKHISHVVSTTSTSYSKFLQIRCAQWKRFYPLIPDWEIPHKVVCTPEPNVNEIIHHYLQTRSSARTFGERQE